jgi:hypothetical protein
MTDDELKVAIAAIKPKTNYTAIVTVAIAVAGFVWGITQYVGDIPKRPEFKAVTDDVTRIRIEMPVVNGKIQRVEESQARVEKAIERVEEKLSDDLPRRRR